MSEGKHVIMEESEKLPLKRVELSLSKFNEVAIPHHLDLLRQHRANIIKYSAGGEWARVRGEQLAARRASARLRALLAEMEALRRRVRTADLAAFDATTQRARDLTHRAIMDYLGVIENSCRAIVASSSPRHIETSPLSVNGRGRATAAVAPEAGSAVSSDSVGVLPLAEAEAEQEPLLQLQIDEEELNMQSREEMLRGWCALQAEVRALHDVWQHAHAAALQQRDQVTVASARVEETAENVEAARTHLSIAERFGARSLALGGACVGLAAGGPAGLVLGAKAGAVAALAGSLLGYLGVRALTPSATSSASASTRDKQE